MTPSLPSPQPLGRIWPTANGLKQPPLERVTHTLGLLISNPDSLA